MSYEAKMKSYEEKSLDNCLGLFTDNLQPSDVTNYLISKKVMTHEDLRNIDAKTSREARVATFVEILKTRNDNAFQEFVNSLDSGGYKELALSLQEKARKYRIIEKGVPKFYHIDSHMSFIFLEYLLKMAESMTTDMANSLCKASNMSDEKRGSITLSESVGVEFICFALDSGIFYKRKTEAMKSKCQQLRYSQLERHCQEYEELCRLPDFEISVKLTPASNFWTSMLGKISADKLHEKCKALNKIFKSEYCGTLLYKLKESKTIRVKVPTAKGRQQLIKDITSGILNEKLLPIFQHEGGHVTSIQLSVSNPQPSTSIQKDDVPCRKISAVPLCLPSNFSWDQQKRSLVVKGDVPRGELKTCQEGVNLLKSIGEDYVIVVCITGPARSGKSFFLSQFDTSVNFEVGHTVQSKTTGIWVAVGHDCITVGDNKARLVLLDAEGMDAIATADKAGGGQWDRKVFSMCMLLSSHLIYNSRGVPDNNDLDKLGLIAQFSESVFYNTRGSRNSNYEDEFRKVSPHFLWLVRDATLEPTIDGNAVSWEEFVTKSVLAKSDNDVNSSRNAIRGAITTTFQSVSAYALELPTSDKTVIQKLSSEMNSDKVNKEFLKGIDEVRKSILSSPQLKRIKGSFISGEDMVYLLKLYLNAVNEQCDKLQIETMWDSSIKLQLDNKRQKCFQEYKNRSFSIELPCSDENLITSHNIALSKALDLFESCTNRFDESVKKKARQSLLEDIAKEQKELETKNETESYQYCQNLFLDFTEQYFGLCESSLTGLSCNDLEKIKKVMLTAYYRDAKGPNIQTVHEENKEKLEGVLTSCRQTILEKALQEANNTYMKEVSKIQKKIPCKIEVIDHDHSNLAAEVCESFNKLSNDCNDCKEYRQRLNDTLNKSLDDIRQSNECRSQQHCEDRMKNLISEYLTPLIARSGKENYQEFDQAKQRIFDEYENTAKGPAKSRVKEKLEADIKTQLEIVEVEIIDTALKTAIHKYETDLNTLLESGPYDPCKLLDKEVKVAEESKKTFQERCQGISSRSVSTNKEILEIIFKDRQNIFILQNKLKSLIVCERQMESSLRDCEERCLELASNVNYKDVGQDVDIWRRLKSIKHSNQQDYNEKSKGPFKCSFGKKLERLIDYQLSLTKRAIADRALTTSLEVYEDTVENIRKQLPLEERDIFDKFSTAAKRSKALFDQKCQNFDAQSRQSNDKVLDKFTKDRTARLFASNYTQSLFVGSVLIRDLLEIFQRNLNTIIIGKTSCSNLQLMSAKNGVILQFNQKMKGPTKQIFEKQLSEKLDFYLNETRICLKDKSFQNVVKGIREKLFHVVSKGPHSEDDLAIECEKQRQNFLSLFREMNEETETSKMKTSEDMLHRAIDDIIAIVKKENKEKSFNQCMEQIPPLLEKLEKQCDTLCNSILKGNHQGTHLEELFNSIAEEIVCEFNAYGKGPALDEVRNIFKEQIQAKMVEGMKDIMLCYAHLGKAEYRQKVDDVASHLPLENGELEDTLDEIEREVMEKFNKVIFKTKKDSDSNEADTTLRKPDIREYERILTQFMSSLRDKTVMDNRMKSLDWCKSVMSNILNNRKLYRDKLAMREAYTERAFGPMKDDVWESYEEEINIYYMSWVKFLHKRWKEW